MSAIRTDIHPLVQAGLDHISQGITIFDRGLRLVSTLLEPALILSLVGLVGFVALAVYLPILSLLQNLR